MTFTTIDDFGCSLWEARKTVNFGTSTAPVPQTCHTRLHMTKAVGS